MKKIAHKNLTDANMNLYLNGFNYFYEFFLYINCYESELCPTAGVNVNTDGMNMIYNKEFIESLSLKQNTFLILHEISHLLFNHPSRTKRGGYDRFLSNIAQDMIINSLIDLHYVSKGKDFIEFPDRGKMVFVPKEYTGEWVFEELYVFLQEKKEEYDKNKKEGEGESKSNKGNSQSGNGVSLEKIFDRMDEMKGQFFDEHMKDSIPDEMKKQIVESVKKTLKNRGIQTGDFEEFLKGLHKPKKDLLSEIKRQVSFVKGRVKYHSFKRFNRRGIFGAPGNVKYGAESNIILDTSGSMNGWFEDIISQIFTDGLEYNLIQNDTEIKDITKVKNKNQLKKLKIKGLGGTVLQPAIDYVIKNLNASAKGLIVLTDGYTDDLNFSSIKGKVLIITCEKEANIVGSKTVKQIVIKKEDSKA